MGAAGAQGRGPLGGLDLGDGGVVGFDAQHALPNQLRIQLIHIARELLAHAVDTGGLDLLLHEGVQLLDNIELLHLGGEIPDQIHGQGIGQAQLQEGSTLREHLLGVLVADGGGDNAYLAVAQLDLVEAVFQCGGAAVFLQLFKPLLHQGMI